MIRKAELQELPLLYDIGKKARAYMVRTGNPTQWDAGYPDLYLREDIKKDHLYVLTDEKNCPHAFLPLSWGKIPATG